MLVTSWIERVKMGSAVSWTRSNVLTYKVRYNEGEFYPHPQNPCGAINPSLRTTTYRNIPHNQSIPDTDYQNTHKLQVTLLNIVMISHKQFSPWLTNFLGLR